MVTAVLPLHSSRFTLLDLGSDAAVFADDVRRGLTSMPKSLPPRWFYDALGSALFEAICQLPEYYVTRAESEILLARREEIAAAFGPSVRLVELGSGSARKTRLLFEAMDMRELEYVPVDVDAGMLTASGRELLNDWPEMRVRAVRSDFSRPSRVLSALPPHDGRTVVLFLGSTIGNLDPAEATAMLRDLRSAFSIGDALFLGADLRKPKAILDAAYDDPLGVTAAFNLNLLQRMNRELGAHFELAAFRHRAFYDEAQGRIEMHLVSTRAQQVAIDALSLDVVFAEVESIHTENSYKHDDATLQRLAEASGFAIERQWTDSQQRFVDLFLVAK